jgi:hypothetical protein
MLFARLIASPQSFFASWLTMTDADYHRRHAAWLPMAGLDAVGHD